jgi:ABC-type Fe3+-hydroxamate transport system substrate-binding protein
MIEVADVLGRTHAFPEPPARVVSLVPSLTETLFDIGAGGALAAITDYCLFPEEAIRSISRIGGTKNPRVEAIRALIPDLVYVNVEENLARDAEAIGAFAPVFATEPKSVAGVLHLLADLGRIHRREEAAAGWRQRISHEIALAGEAERSFSFACAIWKDPWMWCGGDTYVSDLVATAGGSNVLARKARYPRLALEEVIALAPEVVFLPDEPYVFTEADAETVRELFGGRVIGPFPGHLFTWHGTRTAKGLEFLRGVI